MGTNLGRAVDIFHRHIQALVILRLARHSRDADTMREALDKAIYVLDGGDLPHPSMSLAEARRRERLKRVPAPMAKVVQLTPGDPALVQPITPNAWGNVRRLPRRT